MSGHPNARICSFSCHYRETPSQIRPRTAVRADRGGDRLLRGDAAPLPRARHGGDRQVAADRAAGSVAARPAAVGRLLAFVAPSLLILPIKLSAVWFALHHRYGLSALSRCRWQDAGDGPGGAALSRPAADADEDAVVPAGPRPGSSTGATGSTPSCAPCRPGSGPRRWSSACGAGCGKWFRRLVTLGFAACRSRSLPRRRSAPASKASTAPRRRARDRSPAEPRAGRASAGRGSGRAHDAAADARLRQGLRQAARPSSCATSAAARCRKCRSW